jgi:hypothetical protein
MAMARKMPRTAALALLTGIFLRVETRAADIAPPVYDALSTTLVQRAEDEVARIKALVEGGTLARIQLDQAEAKLVDVKDEAILMNTLYGPTSLQNMTDEQTNAMLAAARRRVDRQEKLVSDRRTLLEAGVLARSELAAFEAELDARKRVLTVAEDRIRTRNDLRAMADAEARFERAARLAADSKQAMLRYDGNGLFKLSDLRVISAGFEQHFHHVLPVSAVGETLLHESMGLDHRNRADVALNPDSAEGAWLRKLLESLRIPYLAFRSAIAGAATAPHIHIGPGSVRLALAKR